MYALFAYQLLFMHSFLYLCQQVFIYECIYLFIYVCIYPSFIHLYTLFFLINLYSSHFSSSIEWLIKFDLIWFNSIR